MAGLGTLRHFCLAPIGGHLTSGWLRAFGTSPKLPSGNLGYAWNGRRNSPKATDALTCLPIGREVHPHPKREGFNVGLKGEACI